MSNNLQIEPPADLNTPSFLGSTSNILALSSAPRSDSRRRTTFQNVQNKVLQDANNEDIQLDIDDNEIAQEYFKPDPEKSQEQEDEETLKKKLHTQKDTNPYETGFKPMVFFKFFIMHMIFFCLLGPLMFILSPIFGWYVIRNQEFIGFNRHFIQQTIEYAVIITFLVMYYVVDTVGLQAIEVYMLFVAMIIRMITIASKYAYQSELFLRLMHTTVLSKKDLSNDLMLGRWRLQTDEVIMEEIQGSILRLEIDSSLFFFNFLGEPNPNLKSKLVKESKAEKQASLCQNFQQIMEEDLEGLGKDSKENVCLCREETKKKWLKTIAMIKRRKPDDNASDYAGTPKDNNAANDVDTNNKSKSLFSQSSTAIFRSFLSFMKPQLLESKYLYGYNLILDLTRQAKSTHYKNLGKSAFLISVIRGLLPTFYRAYLCWYKKEDIPVLTDRPYIVLIIFMLNSLFFWFNLFTLFIAVQDFKSKVWCFKQLGYMISPKKINEFKAKKLYPTLNIFDPVTLKTWSSMRRIMKDYGKKYILRNNFNITVSMILYSFILSTFILQMLGVLKTYSDPLVLIVFGFESVVFFCLLISVMTGAAFLNNQYQVHRNLLKKNKTIISDFAKLSHLYVGKDPIKPDNMIYKEGLKVLKKELGKEDFENKLIQRGEKLISMIDEVIEELEFEEANEPFTIMGIKVDYKLLQSMFVGVASLIFAVSQSFVN